MKNQSLLVPATSITIKAMPRKAKTYVAFVQNKAVVFATAFMLLSNFLVAQNCADFDIKFLQTNVMACSEEAVFYVEESSITPPPTVYNIDVHTWAGFTFSTYNYDPGMGTLTFYGVAITAYKQFGTFTATVHYGGGHCEISGKVVACCNEGLASALIVVDEDITDQTTATTLTGDVIFMGDVTFAANSYLFNATRVFLGPDAQLLPQVNADFTFRDANLQPFCECRWDRILLADASNTLSMDETTMRGALRGINATTAVATSLTASNFLDNFVSIYIENSTGTGPYNNSYFKVDGCTFDLLNDPTNVYCYDNQLSVVNMAAISATTCHAFFVTDVIVNGASNNVHIGHENYTMNKFKNTVNADKKHISFNDSQGYVRNNQFANGYFCGLSDALIFVGGTVAQMNVFSGVLTEFTGSAAILQNNSYANGSVTFTNPSNGTVPGGSSSGCEMAYNDFNGTGILVDGNNTNVRFRIFDNYMYNSPPTIREIPGSGSNKVIFHSNYLENNTTAALAIIDECDLITFANNHLEQLTFYTPADLATYNGVLWSDTKDAIVSNNYLENCARGFSISGVNTTNVAGAGTQFTCNEFVNCFHAFYLNNFPSLLTQGSSTTATDNCYNYFYSGSYPYGEQIAGDFSGFIDWYMRTATSCNSSYPVYSSCFCTKTTLGLVTNVDLKTGSSSTCNIPPSTKTAPIENYTDIQLLLTYYLNPVATELTLKFETPTAFTIYNLQGQQLYAQQGQQNAVVDVRQWSDGTYIIRTATQNGKFVVRK